MVGVVGVGWARTNVGSAACSGLDDFLDETETEDHLAYTGRAVVVLALPPPLSLYLPTRQPLD